MNKLLKGKIFGMPRWVFFILLAVGIAGGLYLRQRSVASGEDEGEEAEDYAGDDLNASPLDGIDEPGLAGGVGVVSPPGGVYPVQTPYIPEGIVEIIGGLGGTVSDLASGYGAMPNAVNPDPAGAPPGPAPGGPPNRPAQNVRSPVRPSKAQARKRVQAIAKRHGSRSPQAKRARKRLGIKPPPPRKKARR